MVRDFDKRVNKAVGESIGIFRSTLSQEDLAHLMNDRGHEQWTQSTVSAVENGNRPLKVAEALSLAKIFGVGIDDLLDRAQVRLDQAVEELHVRGMAFVAATVEFDRARRLVESVGREYGVTLDDMKLGAIDRELASSPIDRLAIDALSEANGKVSATAELPLDAKPHPKFRVKPKGPPRPR